MAGSTDGLAGATVTASPRKVAPAASHPNATTRSSGRFTIDDVSIGWHTITVTKEGYSFPPRDVHVSGGTVDIGDLEAMGTVQAANVEAERIRDANGAFTGGVEVSWDAGGDTRGTTTYAPETCVLSATDMCDETSTWASASFSGDGASVDTIDAAPADSDNGFRVRIVATRAEVTVDGTVTVPAATATSEPATVAAINASPSGATATRDIDGNPDSLIVEWDGDRDTDTDARVIGSFDDGETWVLGDVNSLVPPTIRLPPGTGTTGGGCLRVDLADHRRGGQRHHRCSDRWRRCRHRS